MKVLVIRFSSIGDIVLTTPVVRCLKKQKPEIEVHYLTKKAFKDILVSNPYIDKLHLLEDSLDAVIDQLKAEQFDYVIDLHHNARTLRIKRALKVPVHSFDKLNVKKWLLVNFKIDMMPDVSIVERYLDTVKELGVYNDGGGLDYFVPDDVQITNKDIPMSHWPGYVGCVIGGSYETKKFPIDKWKEFCTQTPFPIMLLGGPEDADAAKEIAAIDPLRIYNACGKFSINESALLVKHAKIVVSNDTGLMHVAAAYKKTVISLWGNTSPEMGMFPYYGFEYVNKRADKLSIIMEKKALYCHPCSKLGYKKCPEGHFKCMRSIETVDLSDIVKKNWQYPNQ